MKIFVVRVSGFNLNRLIEEISDRGIQVNQIKRESIKELFLEISSKEYKKLIDLKISTCYNINVIEKKSQYPLLEIIVKRFGIILSVIVASYFLVDFSSRIWNIKVDFDKENLAICENDILSYLNEQGVTIGAKLDISTRALEKLLLQSVDESSIVVVQREGICLNIFIKTRELKDELSTSDIVAEYDGVIKEIKLSSGILVTNIGEAVVKGQVLIASGLVGDLYNEAVGEVVAKTRIMGDAIGSINSSSYVRSGNVIEVDYLELFGKKFYMNDSLDEAMLNFAHHEIEVEERLIFNGNLLPIKKCKAKIYELKEEIVTMSNAGLITRLKEQAYQVAIGKLPEGAEQENVSYDVFNDGEYYRVVCNIETTINIGKRV